MKRQRYYNYISENLEILSSRIRTSGKLNILDLHIHAEPFYRDLLNMIYDLNLEAANIFSANEAAIDLVDDKNKVIIQVSATATKQKIESTLSKEKIQHYVDQKFKMKFMFIANDAKNLRNNSFKNPYSIDFTPKEDILDKVNLLTAISQLKIGMYISVRELFMKEFGGAPSPIKINNNLATIVNLLASEDLDATGDITNLDAYNINAKIEFNELSLIEETTITEYMPYYSKLDNIYKIFDHEGKNKRISVLRKLTSFYEKELHKADISNVEKFFNIVNSLEEYVIQSNNIDDIDEDVIEMCVKIIVVDGFIRCKIFKNPRGYNYVVT